ncbi:hypothetical protein GUY44_22140 [Pimelobacter simplex]|nr:ABC transporter substrate-binding protein [Pimelobacter simplex]MCG8153198.1 hypothetical protein [Pimelobacter simplex]GEB14263.1 hypothetical protein NSI01_25780 [Pimelobacter simplex]SFM31759.1 peptide/nickel transport system substrate-binding protein [Pimelobacter simplex]
MSAITSRRSARALIAATSIMLLATACTTAKEPPTRKDGALGSLPTESGKPKDGGTISVALPVGLSPSTMFPIPSSTDIPLGNQLLVRNLYAEADIGTTDQVNADLSLAELPEFGADGKTVSITLKDGNSWSDGAPVVADDLIFTIDLIKAAVALSPVNYASYTPGGFPDNVVSATAKDEHTVELKLTEPINPGYFLHTVAISLKPLPSSAWNIAAKDGPHLDPTVPANAKKIYSFLAAQGRELTDFTTNPLWKTVNGPFRLTEWDSSTGGYTLEPNPEYTGSDTSRVDAVQFRSFTSTQAMLNQLLAGELTVGTLDASFVTQADALEKKGYHVYGRPGPAAVNPLVINFANETNNFDKVIAQLYVRQALQHLVDQPGYIKSRGVYNGAATPNYSTAQAGSRYAPTFGDEPPYPYDPEAAKKLLTDHGWKVVPDGRTTCVSPGTGPSDCGAGIPEGQDLSFNLLYANSPAANVNRDLAFISEARKLGITITGEAKALNFLYKNVDNNGSPAYKDKWAMVDEGAFTMGAYPAASFFLGSKAFFNLGSYDDPKADALFEASVHSTDPEALVAETTYLGENLPWLFMPNVDNIAVWSDKISGPAESFANLTAYGLVGANPQAWYFTS